MRNTAFLLLLTFLITSCGGSKKIATTAPTTAPVVQPTTPTEEPAPTIETPEEIEEVIPETIPEPNPVIEEVTKPSETVVEEVMEAAPYFDHSSLQSILSKHVSPVGNVNYAAIKQNWSALRGYIKSLADNMPTNTWSKNEKLAYWMNAYNAMTVDLILRNQPLSSIKDVKKPWDQSYWKLGDKWYNLNEIEHKILRKMGDPRIHFGINCASFSCPPLLNEAFTAETVDAQLDKLARNFINDKKRNTISSNSIEVSKIFTWFAKDFKQNGTLIDFLNKYSEVTISPKAKKSYKDYDWTLNN